jgi:hypothetical protein
VESARLQCPVGAASLHPAAGVLAAALLDRRTMTGDEVGVLLSAVTTPRALWVA